MGRFDEIKNKINANINENGEQRITGQVLNEVLIDEVNTIDEVITELEESIGQGGGGGITEEKEIYIGEEEPTDDGAKLWIDPQGTPSGGNGGGTSGGSASALIVYPGVKLDGTDLTEAQKSNNAAVYAELKEANESDRTLPFVSVDLSDSYRSATGGRASVVCTCFGCIYLPNVMAVLSIAFDPTAPMNFQLTEDGNVVLETQQTN